MHSITLLLLIALFIGYIPTIASSDDHSDDSNNDDDNNNNDNDITCCEAYAVTGAGTLYLNGVYKLSHIRRDNAPSYKYMYDNEVYHILRFRFSKHGRSYWYISRLASIVSNDYDYYRSKPSKAALPPAIFDGTFQGKHGMLPNPSLHCVKICDNNNDESKQSANELYRTPHDYNMHPSYLFQMFMNLGYEAMNHTHSDTFNVTVPSLNQGKSNYFTAELLNDHLILSKTMTMEAIGIKRKRLALQVINEWNRGKKMSVLYHKHKTITLRAVIPLLAQSMDDSTQWLQQRFDDFIEDLTDYLNIRSSEFMLRALMDVL